MLKLIRVGNDRYSVRYETENLTIYSRVKMLVLWQAAVSGVLDIDMYSDDFMDANVESLEFGIDIPETWGAKIKKFIRNKQEEMVLSNED